MNSIKSPQWLSFYFTTLVDTLIGQSYNNCLWNKSSTLFQEDIKNTKNNFPFEFPQGQGFPNILRDKLPSSILVPPLMSPYLFHSPWKQVNVCVLKPSHHFRFWTSISISQILNSLSQDQIFSSVIFLVTWVWNKGTIYISIQELTPVLTYEQGLTCVQKRYPWNHQNHVWDVV